jgi:energy-coupling factor transporter ATP-binding protein EcfA2
MKLGFPVVVDGSGVVNVWFELNTTLPGMPPTVCCHGLGLSGSSDAVELSVEHPFAQPPYNDYVTSIVGGKRLSVTITLDGDPRGRAELWNEKRRQLDFSGGSGTLCMAILDRLEPEHLSRLSSLKPDTLFAGYILRDQHLIGSMNGSDASLKDCRAKIAHAINNKTELWLLEGDRQAAIDNSTLDSEALNRYVKAFRSPKDTGIEWLIAELAQGNKQVAFRPPSDEHAPLRDPTTHMLIRAALPSADREGGQDERVRTYLDRAPPLELLPIQRAALENNKDLFYKSPGTSFKTRHVLLAGPTGCGKTFLMKLVTLNGIVERGGGVLYLGPIRAIVNEFHQSFIDEYGPLLDEPIKDRIYLSSGDVSLNDGSIKRGDFALACVVNEKANVLLSADDESRLLERLNVVIIDELHMLCEPFRGGVLDLLLTKLLREARRREERRRQEPRTKPLQIIGISTEGIAEELRTYSAFDLGEDEAPLPPLPMQVDRRPVKVHHQLAVMFDKPDAAGHNFDLRSIVEFELNAHREIKNEEDLAFEKQFKTTFGQTGHWLKLFDDRVSHHDGAFMELVVTKAREHASVIVAAPGIKKLESLANGLYKALTMPLDERQVPREFVVAVKQSGLTSDRRTQLLRWAGRGIFIHHGQYPRGLRRAVEMLFSSNEEMNFRQRVLFTTETLAYGVNLSASCLLLYSTVWPRDDVHDPFSPASDHPTPLSQNEYHNLLGRAGRLGRNRASLSEAIVCVPARELKTEKQKEAFISSYYVVQPMGKPASGAVTSEDFGTSRLRFVRDASNPKTGTYEPRTGTTLRSFTYPCFRTVMDALRAVSHGGEQPATADEVMHFLEDSVAFQSLTENGHKSRFRAMVAIVLEMASDYQENEGNLRIVNCKQRDGQVPRYSIALPGSALIDTGTRLESVEPINRWLDALALLGLESTPVELVVAGLICTPDFLKVGIELTAERNAQQPSEEVKNALDLAISDVLRLEMSRLGLDSLQCNALVQQLDSLAQDSVVSVIKVDELMPLAIKRLVGMSLMWLRGASVEEIEALGKLRRETFSVSQIQPKHAERLFYLCQMCYRFFEGWTGKFVEGHKTQLPRLALRLKFGLPQKAIPLFNAFSADGLLPREGVTQLSEQINSALELLDGREETARNACSALIRHEKLNVERVEDATEIVQRFFSQQISAMIGLLSPGYAEAPAFLRAAERALLDDFGRSCWPAAPVHEPLAELLNLEPRLRSLTLRCDIGVRALRIFETQGVGEVQFLGPNMPTVDGTWRVANWFDSPSSRGVTPCAFVLLMSLLERGLVELKDLVAGLGQCRGLVGVRMVVENVMRTQPCESVPRLREGLLELFEPAMV